MVHVPSIVGLWVTALTTCLYVESSNTAKAFLILILSFQTFYIYFYYYFFVFGQIL